MHRTTIEDWRKRLELPKRMSRAEVEKRANDYKAQVKGDGSLRDVKLGLEIKRLQVLIDAAQLEYDRTRETMHLNSDCESEWERCAHLVRTHVENLPDAVLPDLLNNGLPNTAASIVRELLTERVKECLTTLSKT